MKKLMFVHHWGGIGGAGISLIQNLEMLKDYYDIIVYCPNTPRDMADFLIAKGFKVKTYNFPIASIPFYSGGSDFFKPSFYRNTSKIYKQKVTWENIIQEESPDIVLVNSVILIWMGSIIKKSNAKAICFVRETFKERKSFINRYMKKILNSNFDGVLFISNYDLKKANLTKPIVNVINDCIQNEVNYSSNEEIYIPSSKKFTILFVGGINKLKGTMTLIKSLNILKENTNINLKIAGYSKKKERKSSIFNLERFSFNSRVLRYIEKNGLEKNIHFVGLKKDLNKEYAVCDVLVFPSDKPHQSRPLFEAGFHKVPAIISDFPQTQEFIKNNVNGLTFKPRNYKELAQTIKFMYSNEELRIKMGEKNFLQSNRVHSFKVVKEKLLKTIKKIEG